MKRSRRTLLTLGAAGVVFAVAAVMAAWYFSNQPPGVLSPPQGPQHPDANPVTGYLIEVARNTNTFTPVGIMADGQGCDIFSNEDANRTCRIATSVIPSAIGGEAYGELNFRHTPAFDALVWRARADADTTVCARGGLEGDFLRTCESDAVLASYEYKSGDIRVRVPIGGADPVPTTAT